MIQDDAFNDKNQGKNNPFSNDRSQNQFISEVRISLEDVLAGRLFDDSFFPFDDERKVLNYASTAMFYELLERTSPFFVDEKGRESFLVLDDLFDEQSSFSLYSVDPYGIRDNSSSSWLLKRKNIAVTFTPDYQKKKVTVRLVEPHVFSFAKAKNVLEEKIPFAFSIDLFLDYLNELALPLDDVVEITYDLKPNQLPKISQLKIGIGRKKELYNEYMHITHDGVFLKQIHKGRTVKKIPHKIVYETLRTFSEEGLKEYVLRKFPQKLFPHWKDDIKSFLEHPSYENFYTLHERLCDYGGYDEETHSQLVIYYGDFLFKTLPKGYLSFNFLSNKFNTSSSLSSQSLEPWLKKAWSDYPYYVAQQANLFKIFVRSFDKAYELLREHQPNEKISPLEFVEPFYWFLANLIPLADARGKLALFYTKALMDNNLLGMLAYSAYHKQSLYDVFHEYGLHFSQKK